MGIKSPNYTPFPNELLDEWLGILTPAEWCVLSYLVRHTFGYRKEVESLTYQHFLMGVMRADGSPVDRGCGVKSYTTIHNALVHLSDLGLIEIQAGKQRNGATGRSSYRPCVEDDAERAFASLRGGSTATVKPDRAGSTATVKPALQLLKSRSSTATVEPIKDRKENPKENHDENKTVCGAGKPRRARSTVAMVSTQDDAVAPRERRLALKLAGDVLGCRMVNVQRLARYEAFCVSLLEAGWSAGALCRWMDWMNSGRCYWVGKSRMWDEVRMLADLEDWDGDGRPAEKDEEG